MYSILDEAQRETFLEPTNAVLSLIISSTSFQRIEEAVYAWDLLSEVVRNNAKLAKIVVSVGHKANPDLVFLVLITYFSD